jgi:hypothetical protein
MVAVGADASVAAGGVIGWQAANRQTSNAKRSRVAVETIFIGGSNFYAVFEQQLALF